MPAGGPKGPVPGASWLGRPSRSCAGCPSGYQARRGRWRAESAPCGLPVEGPAEKGRGPGASHIRQRLAVSWSGTAEVFPRVPAARSGAKGLYARLAGSALSAHPARQGTRRQRVRRGIRPRGPAARNPFAIRLRLDFCASCAPRGWGADSAPCGLPGGPLTPSARTRRSPAKPGRPPSCCRSGTPFGGYGRGSPGPGPAPPRRGPGSRNPRGSGHG